MALLILAHSNYAHSLANKNIVDTLKKEFPTLEVRHLAELYPDFNINVEAEQEALLRHDTVIFQFPVWWYNMPAILKHWFDSVFQYGFAYGEGMKLAGKNFVASFTAGSAKESYHPLGTQHFRLHEFWKNLENTAYLCQMTWHDPIYFHSSMAFGDAAREATIKAEAKAQAQKLGALLKLVEKK